jgi:deoxyribodipyrimidine photolyase-related protein
MRVVLIQSDQLSLRSSLIRGESSQDAVAVLIESVPELTVVPFHKQRLVFVLSAMRHFAEELKKRGYTVEYFRLCNDPAEAIYTVVKKYKSKQVKLMKSASFGGDEAWFRNIKKAGAVPDVIANDMFISERLGKSFRFAAGKTVRMESFYRRIRRATGILMTNGEPVGGRWNFDNENRKPPSADMRFPEAPAFRPDKTTREVIKDVETAFSGHLGRAAPFQWPVTRKQALSLFDDFREKRFGAFGAYQDAMVDGEDTLFHSLLSACMNIGLLDPEEICLRAEQHYANGQVPLNSVEGFVRQILGWREFVYQLYRANMPGFDQLNYLDATEPLPSFYWDADTSMRCLSESIRPVLYRGLSHHIQRLMITGNFALLTGVIPQELNRWYWLAFIDAWHWVVTPNVIGMATYADGGLMASKPYAASANYINRMSDYCGKCPFNPKETIGADACPFNALYWDFLHRNEEKLSENPRMSLSFINLRKKSAADLRAIGRRAALIRQDLRKGLKL